jgi:hypothetical protein
MLLLLLIIIIREYTKWIQNDVVVVVVVLTCALNSHFYCSADGACVCELLLLLDGSSEPVSIKDSCVCTSVLSSNTSLTE